MGFLKSLGRSFKKATKVVSRPVKSVVRDVGKTAGAAIQTSGRVVSLAAKPVAALPIPMSGTLSKGLRWGGEGLQDAGEFVRKNPAAILAAPLVPLSFGQAVGYGIGKQARRDPLGTLRDLGEVAAETGLAVAVPGLPTGALTALQYGQQAANYYGQARGYYSQAQALQRFATDPSARGALQLARTAGVKLPGLSSLSIRSLPIPASAVRAVGQVSRHLEVGRSQLRTAQGYVRQAQDARAQALSAIRQARAGVRAVTSNPLPASLAAWKAINVR